MAAHPIAATAIPSWATRDPVTGQPLAGGALRPHEHAMLVARALTATASPRLALNLDHLTEEGQERLTQALKSGHYELETPEEGALLVVAWLMAHNASDRAHALLEVLGPHMHALRFYPAISAPPHPTADFRLEKMRVDAHRLRSIRPNERIMAQREALSVWSPLYDRLIDLFLRSVMGPPPTARKSECGDWQRGPQGQLLIEGGWPCAHYPQDWTADATALYRDLNAARRQHTLCDKVRRTDNPLGILSDCLGRALHSRPSVTHPDAGCIRVILARYVAKRGLPRSPQVCALRQHQLAQAMQATRYEIAHQLSLLLSPLATPPTQFAPIPSDADLKARLKNRTLPTTLLRKLVQRADHARTGPRPPHKPMSPVPRLGKMLQQLISDPSSTESSNLPLRKLRTAVYRAFHRSLPHPLTQAEPHPVEALPWMLALPAHRPRHRDQGPPCHP